LIDSFRERITGRSVNRKFEDDKKLLKQLFESISGIQNFIATLVYKKSLYC